jgi:hypothetical protein
VRIEAPEPFVDVRTTVVGGMAVTRSGKVYGWGSAVHPGTKQPWGVDYLLTNAAREVMLGTVFGDDEPIHPAGLLPVEGAAIRLGGSVACVLDGLGGAKCWNTRYLNLPGFEAVPPSEAYELDAGAPIIDIQHTLFFTLVHTEDGMLRWFGHSGGTGTVIVDFPVGAVVSGPEALADQQPLDLGGPIDRVVAGEVGVCVWQAGRVRCWNTYLSDGWEPWPVNDRLDKDGETPDMIAEDISLDGRAPVDVVLGRYGDCMLFEEGDVWCVGASQAIGSPGDPASTTPNGDYYLARLHTDERVVDISGGTQMCAAFESGQVRCWGDDVRYGGLGYGVLGDDSIIGDDEDVMDLDFPVVDCP